MNDIVLVKIFISQKIFEQLLLAMFCFKKKKILLFRIALIILLRIIWQNIINSRRQLQRRVDVFYVNNCLIEIISVRLLYHCKTTLFKPELAWRGQLCILLHTQSGICSKKSGYSYYYCVTFINIASKHWWKSIMRACEGPNRRIQ